MQTTRATTAAAAYRFDLLAAADAVARAATPKRDLRLHDEFGPHRGRPFLSACEVPRPSRDAFGRPARSRSSIAYELAC